MDVSLVAQAPKELLPDFGNPISNELLENFASDQLVIDCLTIKLIPQEPGDGVNPIEGVGLIHLRAASEFSLRMYSKEPLVDPFSELKKFANRVPGEKISASEFYDLEATDINGCIWKSEGLLISPVGSSRGTVVTAKFSMLTNTAEIDSRLPSVLNMYFFQPIEVAYTQYLETEVKQHGNTRLRSMQLGAAPTSNPPSDFNFSKVDISHGTATLSVFSKSEAFPPAYETRIIEALRFVTLTPISYCIVSKQSDGIRYVEINPKREYRRGILSPAVPASRPECAHDYWRLFHAYLGHAAEWDDSSTYHPLSSQMYNLINSSSNQLDLVSLLVAIAVEGVLNTEFPDVGRPSDTLLKNLKILMKRVDKSTTLDKGFVERVRGALNAMKNARPKDKLIELQTKLPISKGMINDWQRLRNTTTHSNVAMSAVDVSELYRQCNSVYALLNLLVFSAIEYSGQYTNYGKSKWPVEKFETKVPAA
ncbi:MAG: hypothetical protein ACK5RJ_13365 [Burkholderiales bacterium]|jgi:hypothetical protein